MQASQVNVWTVKSGDAYKSETEEPQKRSFDCWIDYNHFAASNLPF